MLSSRQMKSPAEKTLNIFVSLLLEGVGAGLIIVPSHLGIANELLATGGYGIFGFSCFIIALTLQIATVWEISKPRYTALQIVSVILLFGGGYFFLTHRQPICAFALWIAGLVQLFAALPLSERLKQFDLAHLAITGVTFSAGIILSVSGFDVPHAPLLAAAFLITAFMGAIAVVVPSFKHGDFFNKVQMLPWTMLIFSYVLPTSRDNLIVPAAVLTILSLGKIIPWERLALPQDDILSQRIVLIAFVAEFTLLLFLGTFLFTLEPGFAHHPNTILMFRGLTFSFFILFSVLVYVTAVTVIMTTNSLIHELNRSEEKDLEEDMGECLR